MFTWQKGVIQNDVVFKVQFKGLEQYHILKDLKSDKADFSLSIKGEKVWITRNGNPLIAPHFHDPKDILPYCSFLIRPARFHQ
jgi:hypothetical protein